MILNEAIRRAVIGIALPRFDPEQLVDGFARMLGGGLGALG